MLPLRDSTNHSPERCLSLGVVDGGPRYLRLWRWSESAPFGALVSLSQVIFQCRLTLMPCSMQERVAIWQCCMSTRNVPMSCGALLEIANDFVSKCDTRGQLFGSFQ